MKKLLIVTLVVLLSIALCNAFDAHDYYVHFDGDEVDGPLGMLLAMLFAGGGLVLATVIVLAVAVFLCVLFAGLGVMVLAGLGLGCVVVAALAAPFLLPVLIPLAIVWYIVRRNRSKRDEMLKGAAV